MIRLPELHPDWRKILKYAWSVRFIAVAAVLSGCEVGFPYLDEAMGLRPRTGMAIAGLLTLAAVGARLIAQKQFKGG